MTEPYAVGSLVEKCCSEPGDGHPDGALAKVVSVMGPIAIPGYKSQYGYFVLWNDFPAPVFIQGDCLRLAGARSVS
jgi:hypothetical protein